ncbi:permease [Nocardia asteroides]|uniref:permease n=1 Tax=Nocardia asteroides TaxID=1824 RepID=UPI001E383CA0|nr:permease [Nocardia asteroides]UGT60792.1 permease [Nocardia asteroides]
MTASEVPVDRRKPAAVVWRNRAIAAVALLAVLVVAYLILAAFLPRWWAQRLAAAVDGSFAKGIGWGLLYGGVGTALTLFLLLAAGLGWRRRGGRFLAGAAALLALLAAIPNLLTLTVVLGTSDAAHAGERILDVDAPAFRGAALTGAILAAVLFAAVAALLARRGIRRRRGAGRVVEPAAGKPATDSGGL